VSVYVVFKSGKVVKYNDGERITESEASYVVQNRAGDGLIARIPVANVERIEFSPPCRTLRDRRAPKLPNYGGAQ